jgi:predicted metal-dependent hydrolase
MEPVVNAREERNAQLLAAHGTPIEDAWFEGNILFGLFMHASSVAIPEAERMVIRTVEEADAKYDLSRLRREVDNIIHEETAHSRVHDAYNGYLHRAGFYIQPHVARVERIGEFLQKHFALKTRLAMCAVIEHFTATMAKQVLDTGIFEGRGVDERMDRVWTWHAVEELDHRSTVYDIYLALGGGYLRRVFAALVMGVIFLFLMASCLPSLMRQRGVLWSAGVWRKGLPMLFGKRGVYRHVIGYWLTLFKPKFHPTQMDITNALKKQLHHYHIEDELINYFKTA